VIIQLSCLSKFWGTLYSSDKRIVLSVPKKIEKEFKKRYENLSFHQQEFPIIIQYFDNSGNKKELGKFNYIMTENRYFGQSNYGSTKLIDLIDIQQFENISKLKLNINTERPYPNLKTIGSFIGVLLDENYIDFTFNGCSNSEGLSVGGSQSHKNGYNCDIRYLRKNNEIGASNLCGPDYKNIDTERHITLNTRLIDYGWHYLLSNHSKITLYETKNDPKGRHCDHLHLQSYSSNYGVLYE